MFSESHPARAAPLSRCDDERRRTVGSHSALALCLSILQPASPPQIVAFESWTISAPVGLHPFTLAESQKLDFGPCVCVLPFPLLPLLSDRIDLHLEVSVCNLIVITKRLYYHQSDST